MQILDGLKIAKKIEERLAKEVVRIRNEKGRVPGLVIFLVGSDPASKVYVSRKMALCKKVGIKADLIELPKEILEIELLEKIEKINEDDEVDAIMVQLPLPKKIDSKKILRVINPKKDADCLHPLNFGKFCTYGSEFPGIIPVTAGAVMKFLDFYDIQIKSKKVVVVGNSNISGKPIVLMLAERGATVTICHEYTVDLKSFTKGADILIVSTGVKHLIKGGMISEGVAVIDVGITREKIFKDGEETFEILGDVDFESASKKADYITPVPGGVGPVTVAMLLENVVKLAS